MKTICMIAGVFLTAASTAAHAESLLVCGDLNIIGEGAEVTVAQYINGQDPLAKVVTADHWRIQHKVVDGPYCPFFEIDSSKKVYIRMQTPYGEVHTNNQYLMHHMPDEYGPVNYTGSYSLFLEMVPSPNNYYRWYREPIRLDDGVYKASPTIGFNMTNDWNGMYPLKPGFEEITPVDGAITFQ